MTDRSVCQTGSVGIGAHWRRIVARRTAEENRRNVLGVATRLFYAHGIRAVGMDTVVKECGVGNATVYRQ
ncbi:TetR/AcrR family transcriptional regulator, partial [Pseudomonas aeruginosa]|uniref:TetR/AcrR family transcriptional regulator n=1 Tax=Pseudomonas aeruginosa TaxID=287 RepID=UPI003CEFE348